jgi:hypothetical protein
MLHNLVRFRRELCTVDICFSTIRGTDKLYWASLLHAFKWYPHSLLPHSVVNKYAVSSHYTWDAVL